MLESDELAIALATERRREEEAEQREIAARRAELPRTHSEDAREHWRRWKALGRRLLRAFLTQPRRRRS